MARFDLILKDGERYIREVNDRTESEFGPFASITKCMEFIRRREKQIADRIGKEKVQR